MSCRLLDASAREEPVAAATMVVVWGSRSLPRISSTLPEDRSSRFIDDPTELPTALAVVPTRLKAPLATRPMPLAVRYRMRMRLSTHTSTPSNMAVVRSHSMLRRVEAQPAMNSAISSDRPVQMAAPVPSASPSGLRGSVAEIPMARPRLESSMSTPTPASTPPNTPPQEIFIPSKGRELLSMRISVSAAMAHSRRSVVRTVRLPRGRGCRSLEPNVGSPAPAAGRSSADRAVRLRIARGSTPLTQPGAAHVQGGAESGFLRGTADAGAPLDELAGALQAHRAQELQRGNARMSDEQP